MLRSLSKPRPGRADPEQTRRDWQEPKRSVRVARNNFPCIPFLGMKRDGSEPACVQHPMRSFAGFEPDGFCTRRLAHESARFMPTWQSRKLVPGKRNHGKPRITQSFGPWALVHAAKAAESGAPLLLGGANMAYKFSAKPRSKIWLPRKGLGTTKAAGWQPAGVVGQGAGNLKMLDLCPRLWKKPRRFSHNLRDLEMDP